MNTTITKPAGIASGLPDVGCYIACLASYNNGILYGAWVDLEEATTADEIQDCIDWVLATSPTPGAEEWAMHDHAGLPGYIRRTEWPDIEELSSWATALAEYTDDDTREAFRLACENRTPARPWTTTASGIPTRAATSQRRTTPLSWLRTPAPSIQRPSGR
jgi:antirestriction protein